MRKYSNCDFQWGITITVIVVHISSAFLLFFANPHPHLCASREHLCTNQLFFNKYLSINAVCFLQDFSLPPPLWGTIACLWVLCTPEILHVVGTSKERSSQWVRCRKMMGCIQAEPSQGSSAPWPSYVWFSQSGIFSFSVRVLRSPQTCTLKPGNSSKLKMCFKMCVCVVFSYLFCLRCQKLVFTECPTFR